jgi:protein-disulfide isomerase
MALRDLIEEALKAAENDRRRATIQEVLTKAGGGTDGDILAALAGIIAAREQKAGSFTQAGQMAQADAERGEIAALREFLRQASPSELQKNTPKKKVAPQVRTSAATEAPPKASGGTLSRRQIAMLAVGGVAAAAAVGTYFWIGRGGETDRGLETVGPQKMVVHPDDMTMGNPKAPITVLEYAAPTCPHCAVMNATVIPKLKAEYIDTGKVFYIFRVFAIMPADGAVEAIARSCLPADKYFQFLDLMYRNQQKWDPEYEVTDVRGGILKVSRMAGISEQQMDRCLSDQSVQERLNRYTKEAVEKYDLHGVPDFIINGTLWRSGGVEWPEFKAKLDSLLAKK